MRAPLAADTSVAVPLLVQTHAAHAAVVRWWDNREIARSGYAPVETYSVLTRLPGDLRLTPTDAVRLLQARCTAPLTLRPATARRIPEILGHLGIAGGAVYDALVALAAVEHGSDLATRDARAKPTYEIVGADVIIPGWGPRSCADAVSAAGRA